MKLAAPEDGPLGSKHIVLHMIINNYCVDGGICIVGLFIDFILHSAGEIFLVFSTLTS
jgi:hypothetical protein